MKTIEAQVHFVSTKNKAKKGDIFINGMKRLVVSSCDNKLYNSEYLYFTTDEEIKEGDKVLLRNKVYTFDKISGSGADALFKENGVGFHSNQSGDSAKIWLKENCRKIVASTDPKLTRSETWSQFMDRAKSNGISPTLQEEKDKNSSFEIVPQPTKTLVEDYCKKPFNKCLIEMEWLGDPLLEHSIIKVNENNEITTHPIKDNFTRKELFLFMEKYNEWLKTNEYMSPEEWVNFIK